MRQWLMLSLTITALSVTPALAQHHQGGHPAPAPQHVQPQPQYHGGWDRGDWGEHRGWGERRDWDHGWRERDHWGWREHDPCWKWLPVVGWTRVC